MKKGIVFFAENWKQTNNNRKNGAIDETGKTTYKSPKLQFKLYPNSPPLPPPPPHLLHVMPPQ